MKKLNYSQEHFISYDVVYGPKKMGILYLHGLLSSKNSEKGQKIKAYALENGYTFLSLDYTAHGLSSGRPDSFRVGQCLSDIIAVLNEIKYKEPFIIAGSSLGGWLSFLLAEKYPGQVKGVMAFAPGADFLDRTWDHLFTQSHKDALLSGQILGPNDETRGYCFSYDMFVEAKAYNILNRPILYDGPVLLIHGTKDHVVSYDISLQLMKKINSVDVKLLLVKDEVHALSSCNISNLLDNFLNKIKG